MIKSKNLIISANVGAIKFLSFKAKIIFIQLRQIFIKVSIV